MKSWPVQDAKARFSEFLETCLAEGPQLVTRRGAEAAVLVSIDQWRRLQEQARPSLKASLLAEDARTEFKATARVHGLTVVTRKVKDSCRNPAHGICFDICHPAPRRPT